MVNSGLTIELKPFQEKVVSKLLDLTINPNSKQSITVKSPTGSGKTIFLIDYIDKVLTNLSDRIAFIWLCPGKGNLEEQSRDKMRIFAPHRLTQSLHDALTDGFGCGTTTFINWELITRVGNTALRDGERKNLFDRIADAHRDGRKFIIIIDEEHSNNTANAQTIINAFSAFHIIRASATTVKNDQNEFVEIDEAEVIDAGLITKAIYVNDGIESNESIDNDYDTLLRLADEKRKAIAKKYNDLNKNIRPLVLIQFRSGRPETITAVEDKLQNMGYTYENHMVSKWMSEDKIDLPDNLCENDGEPVFLLMKQAISTGWDCPRAKILVKLRDGGSDAFNIQTVGRIRRMPEAHHYNDDLLDFCYVYTFDETYKNGLLSSIDKSYETRRLFLKDKCKEFTLEKQMRDLDYDGLGERDVLKKIYDFLVSKYHLNSNKEMNRHLLEEKGYRFGNEIIGIVLQGVFVHTDAIMQGAEHREIRKKVHTHDDGLALLHSVDSIKSAIGMTNANVKAILERLFKKPDDSKKNISKKILELPNDEFYAFVINNCAMLKQEFKAVTAELPEQESLTINPKTSTFKIPEEEFYRYDSTAKHVIDYLSNAYSGYTSAFATTKVRSLCEMEFERFCNRKNDIEWIYKNGDSGQRYFSVVYLDGVHKQWLFYPDYIIKKSDEIWIIETKGGELHGHDLNIDSQVENKFNAFKDYAERKKIHWGFVRYKDDLLLINNSVYSENLDDEHWELLESSGF